MADKHKSHPQAPLYGPGGASSTSILTQLKQYESALSIGWSQLTSVPSTISGYGITDAYTDAEVDALLLGKADVGDSYTKAEADALLADKADSATTLAGYGITDAYTQSQVDTLLGALTAADIAAGTFPSGDFAAPGRFAVMGANHPAIALFVGGNAANYNLTGTSQFGMAVNGRFGSDCTVQAVAMEFQSNFVETGSAFTCATAIGLHIQPPSLGVASVTSSYGIKIKAQDRAVKNYAIKTDAGLVDFGDQLLLAASTTSRSTLRIPHGSAPTSPVDGDMWTTTAGLFIRINGATVGPLS